MLFQLSDVDVERGGRTVLRAVTLGIAPGATAVVGPSGSGKSTLLRLLNRLADPVAGTVAYRGRPLPEWDVLELRRRVGMVPQLPALLPGTVEENLRFAARVAGRPAPDAGSLLALAGLAPEFSARDVGALSVGEQQRAMLARALVAGPEVLLLDEPTAALDEASRDVVEATLIGLRARLGLSLVLVTHDPAQAERMGDDVVRVP